MTVTAADPVPRARGTSKLPRARREELLLDIATVEFGAVGYAGASLGRMADRAGVSKALIITYFGSKDGLYAACVTRAGSNLIDRIEAVLATNAPAHELAPETLRAIFGALEERPHDWNLLNDRSVPAGDAGEVARQLRAKIADQARRGVANLRAHTTLNDTDDLAILTEIWMSSVTAIVNWWLRHPERTTAEMTARSQRVIAAITAPAANPSS